MGRYKLRLRQGLGPRIDPHFDAAIGRVVAAQEADDKSSSRATGYIELVPRPGGPSPFEYLKAIFEVIYDPSGLGSTFSFRLSLNTGIADRPNVWTAIRKLRYLTSDEQIGVALPLDSFNPDTDDPGWPQNGHVQLSVQLDRFTRITGNKLATAKFIGLTVDFDFGLIAKKLHPILHPDFLRRALRVSPHKKSAQIDRILFGGLNAFVPFETLKDRFRKFDAQDLAVSGGFSLQLKRAIGELRDFNGPLPDAPAELTYDIEERGRGVIVGVVDFGCDFAHTSLRNAQGSKILALWDQNACPEKPFPTPPIVKPDLPSALINGEPCRFGYGRLFAKQDIDRVLQAWTATGLADPEAPYAMLGYDPLHNYYKSGPPDNAHGTIVLDIVAGETRNSCRRDNVDEGPSPRVAGVAPEAKIVFVQVRTHKEADGRHRLDANDVIDAVAFIFHRADQERLPCVVNLSLNTMSGPHDGDGHFERRLRHLARSGDAGPEMKGRAVVVAAGNVPFWDDASLQWQHIFDNVSSDRPFEFYWSPPQAAPDRTRNSVEIWYDAKDAWLQVSLTPPREQALEPIGPGLAANLTRDGKVYGSIVGSRVRPEMRDKMPVEKEGGAQPRPVALPDGDLTNGRHVILLEIDPQAAATGVWKVRLEIVDKLGEPVRPGDPRWVAFHAWLERDDEGQSGIRRTAEPTEIRGKDFDSTIGTLSCGEDPIVVAAYDASTSQIKPWLQSGRGPRRVGGADKPDISAPGYRVFLVKAKTSIQCQIESGTSLAAPFVTGTIACLYEVAPQATLAMITGALFSTARKGLEGDPHATWTPCLGHGQLRPREAVARIKTMTGVDNT